MTDAVIVAAARTPIATSFKGTLVDVDAFELGRQLLGEVVARSGLDPEVIDGVQLGETLYGGGDVARFAAIEAGMEHIAGVAVNEHCASSLAAIANAAGSIKAGMDRALVAGGVNSMSTSPQGKRRVPGTDEVVSWMSPSHPETPDAPAFDMSITVGWNAAVEAGVTREEMDAWALRSHQRAVAAIDEGRFDAEVFPVEFVGRDGEKKTFAVDEHPRRETTAEKLAGLKVLHPEIDGFSITAGNASGVNDAAAAVVLASAEVAAEAGATVLGKVTAWASAGVNPARTGLAPTIAIPKALERAGLTVADVDLWEINEAFASMCVATTRILGIDEEIVNVSGSGCSLGHPIAASGARMVVSLVHELRRRGGGTGVAAMCAGGGMSTAVVVEVPAP
ncbi:MAG: thiolase family protein [Actinobacteria bacterium]|nr:thiolase family protein [Actinomycetota bacterium]